MRVFQLGETVELYSEVKDQDGAFTAPNTSIKVTIYDPAGTKILLDDPNYDASMVESETGKYVYYYTIPDEAASVGWWRVRVLVTDVAKYTKVRGGFKAEL